jgi:hypothetical protein
MENLEFNEHELSEGIRKSSLCDWIINNLKPIKSINKRHTSYGIKHLLYNDIKIYYTSEEFTCGMREVGYCTYKPLLSKNWCFNVSERSLNEASKRIYEKERICI